MNETLLKDVEWSRLAALLSQAKPLALVVAPGDGTRYLIQVIRAALWHGAGGQLVGVDGGPRPATSGVMRALVVARSGDGPNVCALHIDLLLNTVTTPEYVAEKWPEGNPWSQAITAYVINKLREEVGGWPGPIPVDETFALEFPGFVARWKNAPAAMRQTASDELARRVCEEEGGDGDGGARSD